MRPCQRAALARGDEIADAGHRQRHQSAGGGALDRAGGDQLPQGLGDPARGGCGEEHRHRPGEQGAPAVPVAELAPQRRRGRGGEDVRGDEIGDVADRPEVGGDRRQSGGEHGLVQDRGEHRQYEHGERGQQPRRRDRSCVRDGCGGGGHDGKLSSLII